MPNCLWIQVWQHLPEPMALFCLSMHSPAFYQTLWGASQLCHFPLIIKSHFFPVDFFHHWTSNGSELEAESPKARLYHVCIVLFHVCTGAIPFFSSASKETNLGSVCSSVHIALPMINVVAEGQT